MINQHDFQQAAKSFRAGRLSLQQFTETVFNDPDPAGLPDQKNDVKTGNEAARQPLPSLSPRPAESHKGDFGRVLLIGGAAGMSGAISLSSLAALRCGSGLVKVAVPKEIQSTVAAFSPCYMTIGCLSENGEFHGGCLDSLETAAEWSDVIGMGPGMERGAAQKWIVPKLYRETHQPMIVDADGLNTLADANVDLADHVGQRILTPHPGEFQRILNSLNIVSNDSNAEKHETRITDRATMESRAIELAKSANLIIVLKGNRTLVTDGERTFHNWTGNPGMATAGAGDVLTGVITSLVGQGLPLFDAAELGVYLHGRAGDLAAAKVGQSALIATDIIEYLGSAVRQHNQ